MAGINALIVVSGMNKKDLEGMEGEDILGSIRILEASCIINFKKISHLPSLQLSVPRNMACNR
jgi:hypothetical protein